MKGKKPPMRIWSALGAALVVLVMITGASLAFSPGFGEAAPPPVENPAFPWDVNVVNTEANPVPVVGVVSGSVTGDVNASQDGTWNVGVSSLPAVQLDDTANTVKIDPAANTVQVDSDAANPVYVVMADPVKTPVSKVLLLDLASGTQSGSSNSYHVPSDQWLVIETVSGGFIDWGGVRPLGVTLGYSPAGGAGFLLAEFIPETGPFSTHSVLNATSVRLYAPPDSDVRYGVARAVPPPYTDAFTSKLILSGYLTNEYSIP